MFKSGVNMVPIGRLHPQINNRLSADDTMIGRLHPQINNRLSADDTPLT